VDCNTATHDVSDVVLQFHRAGLLEPLPDAAVSARASARATREM
jgi:hypothetical protein